jgi:hypothetical protein
VGALVSREWYVHGLDRDDILAFARRNRSLVAEAKTAFWIGCTNSLSPAAVLALGDEVRRHASGIHPDWPDEPERAADLAVHRRVTEALGAVSARSR